MRYERASKSYGEVAIEFPKDWGMARAGCEYEREEKGSQAGLGMRVWIERVPQDYADIQGWHRTYPDGVQELRGIRWMGGKVENNFLGSFWEKD